MLFLSIRRLLYSLSPKSNKKSLLCAAFSPPKCVNGGACNTRKGAVKLTAPCVIDCLLFPFLSLRLFCFTLSLPFPELPLAFLAFVVGENVREDAPGNVLNLVLRNTGIVDELLSTAQAGCSLRFDMKLFVCSCKRMVWIQWYDSSFDQNADTCQATA